MCRAARQLSSHCSSSILSIWAVLKPPLQSPDEPQHLPAWTPLASYPPGYYGAVFLLAETTRALAAPTLYQHTYVYRFWTLLMASVLWTLVYLVLRHAPETSTHAELFLTFLLLNTMLAFVSSATTPDAVNIPLATLTVLLAFRVLVDGRSHVLAALALTACALTKPSGLLVFGALCGAMVALWSLRMVSARQNGLERVHLDRAHDDRLADLLRLVAARVSGTSTRVDVSRGVSDLVADAGAKDRGVVLGQAGMAGLSSPADLVRAPGCAPRPERSPHNSRAMDESQHWRTVHPAGRCSYSRFRNVDDIVLIEQAVGSRTRRGGSERLRTISQWMRIVPDGLGASSGYAELSLRHDRVNQRNPSNSRDLERCG
jgi:hypothetical protein